MKRLLCFCPGAPNWKPKPKPTLDKGLAPRQTSTLYCFTDHDDKHGPEFSVVAILVCLVLNADMGEAFFTAPRVRFLESVACSRYYARHDPSRVDRGGSVPERPLQD
ncbi:hypothetical protein MY3296_001991 [Beauveria thailandica]